MSLSITNFSIAKGDILYCDSSITFSVDIIDDTYNVTLSGTYITDNDVLVPYTIAAIQNGYRCMYNTTPSGNIQLDVIATNSNYEIKSETYIMQYGYAINYNEVNLWTTDKEVPIALNVSNKVMAPATSYFSTFFKTSKYRESVLEAIVSVEGSGAKDIETCIYPQSKYFMYGKTYSITVSGIKDFSGNELPPKTYSFTLEDKNI